jgi:hypothetical protein
MHPLVAHWLKIIKVTTGVIVGLIVVPVVVIAFGFWLFTPNLCANSVFSESVAPGGRFKVVVFGRDCGATTGFSTQVSILRTSRSLANEGGNVFVADCGHGNPGACPGGVPTVRAIWVSDHQLRIEHHPYVRVFKSEPLKDDTKVEYVPVTSDG